MYHCVTLQAILVAIVIDMAVKSIGKHSEITYAQRFEYEAEGIEVIDQVLRA